MTSNNDGFLPTGHKTRDILTDNGLPEDSSSQDVTDGTIGALPHLLQPKLYVNVWRHNT